MNWQIRKYSEDSYLAFEGLKYIDNVLEILKTKTLSEIEEFILEDLSFPERHRGHRRPIDKDITLDFILGKSGISTYEERTRSFWSELQKVRTISEIMTYRNIDKKNGQLYYMGIDSDDYTSYIPVNMEKIRRSIIPEYEKVRNRQILYIERIFEYIPDFLTYENGEDYYTDYWYVHEDKTYVTLIRLDKVDNYNKSLFIHPVGSIREALDLISIGRI